MWVTTMIRAKLNYIPLNRAYLCQDCNAVGNSAMHCPACASEVLLGLASVFDRPVCDRPETASAAKVLLFPSFAAA